MAEPFLGEVRVFSFGFAPHGWAQCNGQTLPINQNQALFTLLGDHYGGDKSTTFALPNLQGRTPIHASDDKVGHAGGEDAHVLQIPEMPGHKHNALASGDRATDVDPGGNLLAEVDGTSLGDIYGSAAPGTPLSSDAIQDAGSGQAHENRQPFLALNFCIAIQGIFPSPN